MLFLAVSLKVVGSREFYATIWNMTSESTFPMNSILMAVEIFLQCKSLGMYATGNIALERAFVDLQVFIQVAATREHTATNSTFELLIVLPSPFWRYLLRQELEG